MAAHLSVKPFSPEETQRILNHLQKPAVFTNMTGDWPALRWTAEHLSDRLGDKPVRFRLGRKEETNTPLFETQCSYVEAKLGHFLNWTRGQSGTDVGPFCEFSYADFWAYADYKYIAVLFHDQPSVFEDVKWRDFGFEGRNGRDSTVWIGTGGANTPCHQDSYGCNLVLQVEGRKRWHLFPPDDASKLYPTRIPYEESSVFSRVDVLRPDAKKFPDFRRAGVHVVTLQPGQVLYVPRHWWHYVESVDPITVSVNSWIEMEVDDVARVSEAVTKAVVCAVKSCASDDNTDEWLNPTEEGVPSHNENMHYLNLAIRACAQNQTKLCHGKLPPGPRGPRAAKRSSGGQVRASGDPARDSSAPFSVPFGPHLVSVPRRQREDSAETAEVTPEDLEVKSSRKWSEESPEDGGGVGSRAEPASAVGLQRGSHACGSGSAGCGARDRPDGSSEGSGDLIITTNDLLDCLLHPDIISRVTELLLERHADSAASETPLSPDIRNV